MCCLWSMKLKQTSDMGHLRETTQQFSQFKSSLWTLCAKIAAANSIFSPSAISVRPLSPYPRTSHSELQVQNPAFASCLLEGIAFCWRFCQTWTSSLFAISAPAPFGYLNLITSSIFGGLSRQIFPIVISCGGIAVAEFTSVGDQQHLFEKDCCFTCFAEEAIRFAKETLK